MTSGSFSMRAVAMAFGATLAVLSPAGAGSNEPPTLAARLATAEISYDRAALQLAIDELTVLVAREPQNAEHRYLLARARFPQINLFDWSGAPELARATGRKGIDELQAALALGGGDRNPDAYRVLGDYYGRLSFLEGTFGRLRYGGLSAKYHQMAFARTPTDPRALIGVATDKLQAPVFFGGDVNAAIELLKEALALEPRAAGAHVWLAKAYLKQGALTQARTQFEAARALAPSSGLVAGEWRIALRDHDQLQTAQAFPVH